MCFSATASFTAAAFVGSAGVVTLSRAQGVRELPLAGVPILFAIQQAVEGALWLALPDAADAVPALYLANGFTLIALVIWPLYAPVAVALVEDVTWRRRLIALFALLGILFAAYSLRDIAFHPYRAFVRSASLCYINNSPFPGYAMAFYLPAVCGGFLVSSHRALRLFGLIIAAGLAVSLAAFLEDLVSVWCFFAATASLCLLFHFERRVSVPA